MSCKIAFAMCPIIALSNVACSRCRTSYVRSRHVFYFCVVKCLIGPLLDVLESLRRNTEAIEQTESWISYYNAERPHSAIRMMAPLAYEAQLSKR